MKRAVGLAASAIVCAFHFSVAGALWTVGKSGDSTLYDVTYGQSQYVCVGETGALFTSATGNGWTAATYSGTPNNLYAVAYGNGTFVAVGQGGWTVTSTDGVHWTSASSGATVEDLNAITFATGKNSSLSATMARSSLRPPGLVGPWPPTCPGLATPAII